MPKCSECGFLAVRDEYEPGMNHEAMDDTRKRGYQKNKNGQSTKANFFCYANSSVFPELPVITEQRGLHDQHSINSRLEPLFEQIDCGKYRAYWAGKSPKEHEDMTLMDQMRAQSEMTIAQHREITERHHQESMTFQMEMRKEMQERLDAETISRQKREALADERECQKDAAAQMHRIEDRSLSKTSLAVSAIAIIVAAIVGLIQATKIPWFDLPK